MRGDEPHTIVSGVWVEIVRGECSGLPRGAAPQSRTTIPESKQRRTTRGNDVVRDRSHRPKSVVRGLLSMVVTFLFLVAAQSVAWGQQSRVTTPDVFRQFSDHVIKIEVVEKGSAAKATFGTGFFATARGHVVTNYHVISKLIHAPDRYRVEVIDAEGHTSPATVLAIDVVYDLAVLRTERQVKRYLELSPVQIRHGTRLYSLGYPKDLGLTIVEGTYNGLLQHTLYPKIHFTGSLNPGMSGGPTVTQAGRVVGVNVSSEGNQVSFLVPVERTVALLEKTSKEGFRAPDRFLAEVGQQIHAYQAAYLSGMFSPSTPSVTLGRYELPTRPASFFKCWADSLRKKEIPYVVVDHECSTDDYIYVSSQQSSGIVRLHHQLISSEELNPLRFFALYSNYFRAGSMSMYGTEEEVTPFRCHTRNVRNPTLKFRAALCVRQYLKLEGLYDAALKAAILGSKDVGLVTTLTLSGAGFENVQQLARRYLENVKWRG